MKVILFALFVALLMVGCGEPDLSDLDVFEDATADAVDWSKLRVRDGVTYLPNEETPFTGRAESFYDNGQKKQENNYKDGKRDGLRTSWYDNGIKRVEANYKDGKQDGVVNAWYNNSLLKEKSTYSNGKIVSAFVWKPNGEKCPASNVKNGNGVKLWYVLGSTQVDRITYKDGKRVRLTP